MKTTISLVLFVFLACVSFSQQAKLGLKVLQNGTAVSPVNGEVELKREPFTIELTLEDMDGVYVYADFDGAMNKLNEKDPVPELQEVPYKVMAEENFNTNKELVICNNSWLFWFYDKKQPNHRFDKDVKVVSDHSVIATKTIQQFYTPSSEKLQKIAEVTKPLYLFFLVTNGFQKTALVRELSRQKLKINFK